MSALSGFLRPSTRAFAAEAKRVPGYSRFDLFHGYFYSRFVFFYIAVATGEHWLARLVSPLASKIIGRHGSDHVSSATTGGQAFADTYHGKVVPLEEATRLVTVNRDIDLGDLEHVIPYAKARELVLKHPDHIALLQCPCRTARKNPCLPLDVCLIVGEPFASFMLEHHPNRTRRITPAEAIEVLRAEDERGHVHHAFFKDAMLGRFYAICNCCACCCGAMQAHRNGTPMLASSGYVSRVDEDRCIGCGDCTDFCQFHALSVVDGRNHIDAQACMGCGVCVSHCKHEALSLVREESRGIPLEINTLMSSSLGVR